MASHGGECTHTGAPRASTDSDRMPDTSLEDLEPESLDAEDGIDEEEDADEADEGGADDAPARAPDPSRVAQHVGKFSDRAVQRVVGGNAFLRGRQYARRGDVRDIATEESEAWGRIQVKADGERSNVTVLTAQGAPEAGPNGQRIVGLLLDELK